MLMDISSEMIHSILPLFLVSVLGLPVLEVGLIDGVAEATTQITKAFSGALADHFGKRKLMTLIGYGLAAASKPIFPLAHSLTAVLAARFMDRFGKGIRGAPRDALIADMVPDHLRGASFGLRQALDSVGAVLGPLIAFALMELTANKFRIAMALAVIPAILSVALLAWQVEEKAPIDTNGRGTGRIRWEHLLALGRPYWIFVGFAALLTLPRFGEAFLLLRAGNVGLNAGLVPLVYVAMNIVYSLAAFPAGSLSDRIGRRGLIVIGFGMLIVADIVLALAPSPLVVFIGAALWGIHLALTQGVLSAMVADMAPARLRATAFGLFNTATGCAMLIAGLAAGELWDSISPAAPFWIAAGVMAAALATFVLAPVRSLKKS
jgi:MFS family permease